ncbi:hypothetical protein SCLCIDRAFT_1218977 [Scleroderma citrinum Foug A]|uniref:Uncharacterized protein n=1 Tax=Scleroderma citrinum Foug A TaxID=1036808 RepID=A0A0C2ZZR2_9AGAM|nr:hypothetical protein SCLCIDRAFT_1218977 [Scleroderma citrinum Foug A]
MFLVTNLKLFLGPFGHIQYPSSQNKWERSHGSERYKESLLTRPMLSSESSHSQLLLSPQIQ